MVTIQRLAIFTTKNTQTTQITNQTLQLHTKSPIYNTKSGQTPTPATNLGQKTHTNTGTPHHTIPTIPGNKIKRMQWKTNKMTRQNR